MKMEIKNEHRLGRERTESIAGEHDFPLPAARDNIMCALLVPISAVVTGAHSNHKEQQNKRSRRPRWFG